VKARNPLGSVSHHPHTIENGAGERITFVGVGRDEQGEYLEVRNTVSPGSGPPMHVHHLQEEALTIEQGTMGWQRLGEDEQRAVAGESVTFAAGEPHRFWNAGDDELVGSGHIRTPDNVEYFLTQLYASTRANGGERPRLFDAAYLTRRYRSEFGMTGVPQPVQRILFPLVVGVGRLFGLHRRFAGAPQPVNRPQADSGAPTS
jgi:quercetin dioxygenase-like cupin family protein